MQTEEKAEFNRSTETNRCTILAVDRRIPTDCALAPECLFHNKLGTGVDEVGARGSCTSKRDFVRTYPCFRKAQVRPVTVHVNDGKFTGVLSQPSSAKVVCLGIHGFLKPFRHS